MRITSHATAKSSNAIHTNFYNETSAMTYYSERSGIVRPVLKNYANVSQNLLYIAGIWFDNIFKLSISHVSSLYVLFRLKTKRENVFCMFHEVGCTAKGCLEDGLH